MTTLEQRRLVRQIAGAEPRIPVEVIPGTRAPVVRGRSYGWETRGGRPIYHPSAYAKCGWSNMVYRHSTRRVVVGEQWLLRQAVRDTLAALKAA